MAKQPIVIALSEKITRTIEEGKRLREECGALGRERDKLKSENRELKQRVSELEHRVDILELGESLVAGHDADTKRAQAHINRLMREIDRCMALMNK